MKINVRSVQRVKKNQKINNNRDWFKTFELSRKEILSLNIVKNDDNRNRCYDTIIQLYNMYNIRNKSSWVYCLQGKK